MKKIVGILAFLLSSAFFSLIKAQTVSDIAAHQDGTWTKISGVKGYMVTSKKSGYTDRWIFLPAAGCRGGTYFIGVGSYGDYWSSSLNSGHSSYASLCWFDSYNVGPGTTTATMATHSVPSVTKQKNPHPTSTSSMLRVSLLKLMPRRTIC